MPGHHCEYIVAWKSGGAVGSAGHAEALKRVLERTGRRVEGSCSICLEPLGSEDAALMALDCGHFFHRSCMAEWARQKLACPTCQKPFCSP